MIDASEIARHSPPPSGSEPVPLRPGLAVRAEMAGLGAIEVPTR